MWCDVVICGSLFSSNDDIKKVKDCLLNAKTSDLGSIYYNPIVPFKCNNVKFALPFNEIVREWYNAIDRSCVVIGVTKPDGSFGEGTTYELEYAKKMNKNIIVYDVKKKSFYPYDNTLKAIYDHIFSSLNDLAWSEYLENSEDLQDRKDGDLVDS